MKHIKIFDTVAHLNQFKSSQNYIKPNVSLCEDNPTVMHYDPYVAPVATARDYVEIGGIKWATMNLGASSVTDPGLYYQWGDTQGYTAAQVGTDKNFEESDYKYYDNGYYTKYNATDGLITLLPEDDAVTANWGGNWRMPTISEWQILDESISTQWTNDYQGSGVAGLICTDNIDNSKVLFLPAGGRKFNNMMGSSQGYDYVTGINEWGFYWSSSLHDDYDDYSSRAINFDNVYYNNSLSFDDDYPCKADGYNIRGILDE